MDQLKFGKLACIIAVFCVATAVASNAQTFKSLFSFDGTDGSNPYSPLVEGTDGYFYGTTCCGGANGVGTVFRISRAGVLTTMYDFCAQASCSDGSGPYSAGLVLATDGNFYGTTGGGGTNNRGTIFKITPAGALTTLYRFTGGADGWVPQGLTLGSDGHLYGMTQYGGYSGNSICLSYGCGTVFKITTSGTLTKLYDFCSQANCSDGQTPFGGVVQANDGNFYGTTFGGGINNSGTVFKMTPSGALITLYKFCSQTNCTDGVSPEAGLVQANNGNLYGTTYSGGPYDMGNVFEITPAGVFTTVHGFCALRNCPDGGHPDAAVVLGSDGNIYGTTQYGNTTGPFGEVFRITPGDKFSALYDFCSQTNCDDGAYPNTLIQATNGKFYGTTSFGGTFGPIWNGLRSLSRASSFCGSNTQCRQGRAHRGNSRGQPDW